MHLGPSLHVAVAKFVSHGPSVGSQNDSIILTRMFFPPWEREARGSVGDLDWLTTALPMVGWDPATNATTLLHTLLPDPHQYYYMPCARVAPLHCQPPSASSALSLQWCKQTVVWLSSGIELVFMCAPLSIFSLHMHGSACVWRLCNFLCIELQHIHPEAPL